MVRGGERLVDLGVSVTCTLLQARRDLALKLPAVDGSARTVRVEERNARDEIKILCDIFDRLSRGDRERPS